VVCGVTAVASAPAKIILFGEHFVVFGEPAIVLAIDKRAYAQVEMRKDKGIYIESIDLELCGFFDKEKCHAQKGSQKKVEKELAPVRLAVQRVLDEAQSDVGVSVEIRSDIPVAAGLGSSAAVAAATAKAVSHLFGVSLSLEEIFNIACEAECIVHGTSSGIDPTVATYGGVLVFKREERFTRLSVRKDVSLVVGNTCIQRCTGDLVSKVQENREKYPSIISPIIRTGGEIATQAIETLKQGNLQRLGELMNINHALLYAVGVSSEPLEKLVNAARNARALGAKLTGAGGGGCMIALAESEKLKQVENAIKKAGGTAFIAKKSDEGVRIEG
jgi:mevalonate kinase